jgi:hypothetical protein
MSFTTWYGINVKYDSGLAAEKKWVCDVLYKPTAATSATSPSVTTGPLGSDGDTSATRVHGDGTAAGFASPLDALTHAINLIEGDRAVGN